MIDNFTDRELRLAIFKTGLDNASMLRIVLANQVKIMKKLGIEIDVPGDIYNDLMPGSSYDDKNETSLLYKSVDPISGLLQKRTWEWVHMNQAAVDNEENKT
jgi:hypothetical protein